jgi:hypothetical protein
MTANALQVAVLDDYQNAARDFGPWPELAGSANVTFFTDHVTGAPTRWPSAWRPHIGYVTAGTYQAFYGGAVEAIRAFLAGHPIRILND